MFKIQCSKSRSLHASQHVTRPPRQLVYSSTVLERTHEPCVPTCLLLKNYLVIQLILKFKTQCSKLKVKNLNVQSQN